MGVTPRRIQGGCFWGEISESARDKSEGGVISNPTGVDRDHVLPRAHTVSRCMRSDRQEFGVGAAHSVMALSVSGARPRFARQLPFLLLVFSFKAKKKRKKRTSTKPIWRAGRTKGAITFVQNHGVERMKNRRKTHEEASGCGNAFVVSS